MRKGKNYWTKERCEKEALKYQTKSDFKKYNVGAFSAAYIQHKCLDEICTHMRIIGNKYKRCIYVYEFSDNYAYIGLTSDIERRHKKHLNIGPVYNHLIESITFILKKLTNYVDVNDAIELEHQFIEKYKKEKWNVLNKAKAGGIGSRKKWTKEKCQIEALKYSNRKEFCIKNSGSYRSSLHNGWLNEVCEHMIDRNVWNKENCQQEALKYSHRFAFSKGSKPAYMSALNNDWLSEICEHMGDKKIKRDFWCEKECKKESLKYKTKGEFSIKSAYAYKVSRLNNWLDNFYPKKQ